MSSKVSKCGRTLAKLQGMQKGFAGVETRGGHTHHNGIQVDTSKLLQQSADILVQQLRKIQQFAKQIDEKLKDELEPNL